jgi:exodeoxyribonuclease III
MALHARTGWHLIRRYNHRTLLQGRAGAHANFPHVQNSTMTSSAKRGDPPAPGAGEAAETSKKPKTEAVEVFTTHTAGHVPYDESTMRKPGVRDASQKVISWNVAGLRAFLKKATDDLKLLHETEAFDVLAIQEHKLQEAHVAEVQQAMQQDILGDGFHYSWNCSTEKKGYSGVAIISKMKPLSVSYGVDGLPEAEAEGRVITAEFEDFYVVNVYVPNSGQGLKRLDYRVKEWDGKFSQYVKSLEEKKAVIVTGDMNCAAEAIDIHSPKTNLKSAGYTPEERASFASCYLENGLVDCFRRMNPSAVGFTYWGYRGNLRAKNKGWRLDYFLVSDRLFPKVYDTYHLTRYFGSDHCPLGLIVIPEK